MPTRRTNPGRVGLCPVCAGSLREHSSRPRSRRSQPIQENACFEGGAPHDLVPARHRALPSGRLGLAKEDEITTEPQSLEQTTLEELSADECRRLLELTSLGRIAFITHGRPMLFPVNYRLLTGESGLWILLRTRPGNAIDEAPAHVAFEIDGIDPNHLQGWSVLVRGVLRHLDHNEIELFRYRFDPKPWPQQERTSWLAIKPEITTGRRLRVAEPEWELPSEGYL